MASSSALGAVYTAAGSREFWQQRAQRKATVELQPVPQAEQ
jgi:hypothetical protein